MKKKVIAIVVAAVLLLAAAAYGGYRYFQDTYLVANEEVYRRDITQLTLARTKDLNVEMLCQFPKLKKLDLRGAGVSCGDYDRLCQALPDCDITWELPFQGEDLPLDTRILTVNTLAQEDIALLRYLTALETVDATECADFEKVLSLQETYPGVEVLYRVPLGQRRLSPTITSLVVSDPDVQELGEKLVYFPHLAKLTLMGRLPEPEKLFALQEQYPQLEIIWNVGLWGKQFPCTTQEIDLSGVQVGNLERIAAAYDYFPNLERVVLSGCGKSSEELDHYWKRHPEVRVIWTVKVRWATLRTDTVGFRPASYGIGTIDKQESDAMKYLVDLVCLDLGHLKIKDLSFLEYTTNIEYLILADAHLANIDPVGNLKKLKYFEFFMNTVKDISCLANCEALEDLNMCYNWVRDITPLMELKNLKNVWCKGIGVYWKDWEKLEETIPGINIVYRGNYSSTADGWRKLPNYYKQRDLLGMWYMYED